MLRRGGLSIKLFHGSQVAVKPVQRLAFNNNGRDQMRDVDIRHEADDENHENELWRRGGLPGNAGKHVGDLREHLSRNDVGGGNAQDFASL